MEAWKCQMQECSWSVWWPVNSVRRKKFSSMLKLWCPSNREYSLHIALSRFTYTISSSIIVVISYACLVPIRWKGNPVWIWSGPRHGNDDAWFWCLITDHSIQTGKVESEADESKSGDLPGIANEVVPRGHGASDQRWVDVWLASFESLVWRAVLSRQGVFFRLGRKESNDAYSAWRSTFLSNARFAMDNLA